MPGRCEAGQRAHLSHRLQVLIRRNWILKSTRPRSAAEFPKGNRFAALWRNLCCAGATQPDQSGGPLAALACLRWRYRSDPGRD